MLCLDPQLQTTTFIIIMPKPARLAERSGTMQPRDCSMQLGLAQRATVVLDAVRNVQRAAIAVQLQPEHVVDFAESVRLAHDGRVEAIQVYVSLIVGIF